MLELKIVVKILQLMTALLTVMSRGSPVPVQSDDNSSVISDFSSPFNGSSSYNVSDNLLFFGSVLDNETESIPGIISGEHNETCETEPFCEAEEHPVPDDVQLKVLEQNFDRLRPFFQKDSVDAPEMYRTPAVFDGDDEFVQACETESWTKDRPNGAHDINGNHHFLLNPGLGGYRQSITLLKCSSELRPCRNVEHHLPPSRPTKCETRFWRRQMAAINRDTFKPYEITVEVPVACNCYIKPLP